MYRHLLVVLLFALVASPALAADPIKIGFFDMQTVVERSELGEGGADKFKQEREKVRGRIGAKAFEGMKAAEAKVWCTDCPLAAVQFQQFAGNRPLHPMTVLARAYREDGFGKGGKENA